MGLVHLWKRNRAGNAIARRLRARLLEAYGGGGTYTEAQITRQYEDLRLDPQFLEMAYCAYLEENGLADRGLEKSSIEAARRLVARHGELRSPYALGPVENPYVMSGASLPVR